MINLNEFHKYANIAHCFEEQAMCALATHIVVSNFIFILFAFGFFDVFLQL